MTKTPNKVAQNKFFFPLKNMRTNAATTKEKIHILEVSERSTVRKKNVAATLERVTFWYILSSKNNIEIQK